MGFMVVLMVLWLLFGNGVAKENSLHFAVGNEL
jgi:hypothetical protein